MKRFQLLVQLVFISVWCIASIASAQEIQITTNPADQYGPQIYGNRIVWLDQRKGNQDIYLYDLSTSQEFPVATGGPRKINIYRQPPSIYQDKIVYDVAYPDARGCIYNIDIYLFDLTTSAERQITTDPSEQYFPQIFGNRIVWIDWRNTDYCWMDEWNPPTLYSFDLLSSTESPLGLQGQYEPLGSLSFFGDRVIFGDYICQKDCLDGGYYCIGDGAFISLYDFTTAIVSTLPCGRASAFDIFENLIAYSPWEGGLYLYDLSTSIETLITSSTVYSAKIYGDYITYVVGKQLYYYQISTAMETQAPVGPVSEPDIFGHRIVYAANRSGNLDIFMYVIPPARVEVTPDSASVTEGGAIGFQALATWSDGKTEQVACQRWTNWNVMGDLTPGECAGNVKTFIANEIPGPSGGSGLVNVTYSGVSDPSASTVTVTNDDAAISLEVTPASASVIEGGMVDFQALASFSDGAFAEVACDPETTWQLTGDLTEGACAGNVKTIIANNIPGPDGGSGAVNAVYLGVSDATASAVIVDNDDFLSSLDVTPDSLRLLEGESAGFRALALWSDGSTLPVACDPGTSWTVEGDLTEGGCAADVKTIIANDIPGSAGGSGTVQAAYLGLPATTMTIITVDNDDAPTGTLRTLPADSNRNYLGCGSISQTSSPLSFAFLILLALGIGFRLTRPG